MPSSSMAEAEETRLPRVDAVAVIKPKRLGDTRRVRLFSFARLSRHRGQYRRRPRERLHRPPGAVTMEAICRLASANYRPPHSVSSCYTFAWTASSHWQSSGFISGSTEGITLELEELAGEIQMNDLGYRGFLPAVGRQPARVRLRQRGRPDAALARGCIDQHCKRPRADHHLPRRATISAE